MSLVLIRNVKVSKKAKRLIQKAVQEYQSEDGASRRGSYRDVITDVLHLVHGNEALRVEASYATNKEWLSELYFILDSAYDAFMEEREQAESEEVKQIPPKDLPLYIEHDWEFESSSALVATRLKMKAIINGN